jgi:hypothetical protein
VDQRQGGCEGVARAPCAKKKIERGGAGGDDAARLLKGGTTGSRGGGQAVRQGHASIGSGGGGVRRGMHRRGGGGSGGRGARAAEPGHGKWHCNIEHGSGGCRHVGPRPQYRAARRNLIQFQISNGFKLYSNPFKL